MQQSGRSLTEAETDYKAALMEKEMMTAQNTFEARFAEKIYERLSQKSSWNQDRIDDLIHYAVQATMENWHADKIRDKEHPFNYTLSIIEKGYNRLIDKNPKYGGEFSEGSVPDSQEPEDDASMQERDIRLNKNWTKALKRIDSTCLELISAIYEGQMKADDWYYLGRRVLKPRAPYGRIKEIWDKLSSFKHIREAERFDLELTYEAYQKLLAKGGDNAENIYDWLRQQSVRCTKVLTGFYTEQLKNNPIQ